MEKIKPSGFSKGYSIKKSISVDSKLQHAYNASNDSTDTYHYPNGMAGFVLLALFYVIFIIVTLSIGFSTYGDVFKHQWQNSVLGGGIGYFGFNLLWFIGRTGLFNLSGYAINKFARVIHFDWIKEKVAKFTTNSAIKDVANLAEYKNYSEIRKAYTRKWFYISLLTSGITAVASIIIYLIALYV